MIKRAAAAAVAGAFVSPVSIATSARAGDVKCCTYVVGWQPTLGRHARYVTGDATGGFAPARILAGVSVEPSFAGLSPLALHADGRVLLLASGPSGARIYARRGAEGFRPAFRPPPSDVYPGEGAGLAVAGDRILAVWQKRAGPTADADSGEPHLVLDPGPL